MGFPGGGSDSLKGLEGTGPGTVRLWDCETVGPWGPINITVYSGYREFIHPALFSLNQTRTASLNL